ncbi:MAG: sulfatase-like hydrolase/transferase [Duncaniella sp.]|nr:sulfatase-like hydrolase/transferase [Duncaniella sp.]
MLLYLFFFVPIFFENNDIGPLVRLLKHSVWQPLWAVFLLALAASSGRFVRGLVLVLAGVFFTGELFCYFSQSSRITSGLAIVMMQSNPSESAEFLSLPNTRSALLETLAVMAAVYLFYLLINKLWASKIGEGEKIVRLLGRRSRRRLLTCLTAALALFSAADCWYAARKFYPTYWSRFKGLQYATSPVLYPLIVKDVLDSGDPEQTKMLKEANENVAITAAPQDSLTVVYIIGESHPRTRTGAFGYCKDTTPRISALAEDSSLILLRDVVAPFNKTYHMYRRLMAVGETVGEQQSVWSFPLLPAVMKKAGFRVGLYDNQSTVSPGRNFDFGCNNFMADSDIREQSVDLINDSVCRYDSGLTAAYPPLRDGVRDLTIYHIMGQHVEFHERCPEASARFSPDDYRDILEYTEEMMRVSADFDNAIFITDSLIGNIIDSISGRNAVLVYVPDHGEEGYDFRNSVGRNSDYGNPGMLRTQIQVAAFVWLSPEYRRRHPEAERLLRANASRKIYNTDLPATVIDLAGIGYEGFDREYSLLNPGCRDRRHRWINNTVDYNALQKEVENCPMYYKAGR